VKAGDPREPWFVPLGLLLIGGVGACYHQLLLWCWRLGGVGPIDRRTFGGVLLLLALGALLAWGESPQARTRRRLGLCLMLGFAAVLHWAWRGGLWGGGWGWVALVACGLLGGGEAFWLWRSLWPAQTMQPRHPASASPRTSLAGPFALWLLTLVLPSMLMPYVGVLPL